jgi:hypothetical protein
MTCNPNMHMGIKINPRMHTGTAKIPLCIRGSRCNPRMHMGIACHVIPVCIWGSRCIPHMHTGIDLDPRMHTGICAIPYAYGDRMDTNPRMHKGICASLYAYGDFSVTNRMHTGNIFIREIKSCIPICVILHTGIAVCIWGSPYAKGRGLLKKIAYGDPIMHNEVVRIRGLTFISWATPPYLNVEEFLTHDSR